MGRGGHPALRAQSARPSGAKGRVKCPREISSRDFYPPFTPPTGLASAADPTLYGPQDVFKNVHFT